METKHIVEAVSSATLEVFTTMLSSEPAAGESYTEHNATGLNDGVVSLIGLTGTWIGTGMLTCSAKLACRLSGNLLMSDPADVGDSVNDEVLDSLAEITNMIIGNVKNLLEAEFGELHLSIPTVVYGRNLTTHSRNDSEWAVVPFDCDGERLEVKLCLVPNKGKLAGRTGYSASLQT